MRIRTRFFLRQFGLIMFWAHNLGRGNLYRARGHTKIVRMVRCGAPDTLYQFIIVLHVGIFRVVRGTGMATVSWAGQHGVAGNAMLRP